VSRIPKLDITAAETFEQASKQAVNWRSAEEYKKSACEDLTCDFKNLWCYNAMVLRMCDLGRLLELLCYKSMNSSADRLKR
jgi:hypothetical protein